MTATGPPRRAGGSSRATGGFGPPPSPQRTTGNEMTADVETLSALERRVSMTLAAEEIDRRVDERLKKLAREARMPGFRPGKVPLKLVAQTYGPQVRNEVLGDAVQKAFGDAVRQAKLKVAGDPRIEKKDGGDATSLEFRPPLASY